MTHADDGGLRVANDLGRKGPRAIGRGDIERFEVLRERELLSARKLGMAKVPRIERWIVAVRARPEARVARLVVGLAEAGERDLPEDDLRFLVAIARLYDSRRRSGR